MMANGTASFDGHTETNAALRADDDVWFDEDAMIHDQAWGYVGCGMNHIGVACSVQSGGCKEGIKHRGFIVGHGKAKDYRL